MYNEGDSTEFFLGTLKEKKIGRNFWWDKRIKVGGLEKETKLHE